MCECRHHRSMMWDHFGLCLNALFRILMWNDLGSEMSFVSRRLYQQDIIHPSGRELFGRFLQVLASRWVLQVDWSWCLTNLAFSEIKLSQLSLWSQVPPLLSRRPGRHADNYGGPSGHHSPLAYKEHQVFFLYIFRLIFGITFHRGKASAICLVHLKLLDVRLGVGGES